MHIDAIPPTNKSNINNLGYLIFVHRAEQCPHCINLGPTWNLAAEIGEGLAIFSELNCVTHEEICRNLRIYAVPSIVYYFEGNLTVYNGYKIPREIVNWVSKFVSNNSIQSVDITNYFDVVNSNHNKKVAILFSEKAEIPKIWVAVKNVLNNDDVLFLFSRDKSLHQKLNISGFPGIYFSGNGDDFIEYKGKRIVSRIANFIRNCLSTDVKTDL